MDDAVLRRLVGELTEVVYKDGDNTSIQSCFAVFFSPTAIALGSSAIVKVSGQNCFQTLYGSLGQIRPWPPKGSAEGSTKVPARVHQGSTKVLQVSWCLWSSGQIHLGLPKGSVLKGSVEGSPRFHQGCASFVISVVFWGRSVLGCQKFLWKVPPSLL